MATTAIHGRNAQIFLNEFDFSRQLKNYEAGRAAGELECTTFNATAREYVADFDDGTISLSGYYESDPVDLDTFNDEAQSVLNSSTPNVLTIAPEAATTLSNRALLQTAVETSVSIEDIATGLIMTNASFRGDVAHGLILAPYTTYSATGNGTSVDNAASSASGGVAHLHITAKTGTSPTAAFKVQHSTDNSTWVDLITFTSATGATSERIEASGTVRRYLRVVRTLGGTSPVFTAFVAFARY